FSVLAPTGDLEAGDVGKRELNRHVSGRGGLHREHQVVAERDAVLVGVEPHLEAPTLKPEPRNRRQEPRHQSLTPPAPPRNRLSCSDRVARSWRSIELRICSASASLKP